MKICSKCGIERNETDFCADKYTKDNLATSCKFCRKLYKSINKEKLAIWSKNYYRINKPLYYLKNKEIIAKKNKIYRENNKKKLFEQKKKYYQNNKELISKKNKIHQLVYKEYYKNYKHQKYLREKDKISKINKTYRENHKRQIKEQTKKYYLENKEIFRIKQKEYNNSHKKDRNEHAKKRKLNSKLYKLQCNIRGLIWHSILYRNYSKKSKTHELLGCSFNELMSYLGEKPFDNAHLDHICPCSQAKNEEELLKLQHYTNLQWLSKQENLSKSDKKTPKSVELCRLLLNRDWID